MANWIQGAIKSPGSLHKALGVKQGEKIPKSAIAKAANSRNKNVARKANFAKELSKLRG